MGLDGFSMGVLGLNTEMTSAQMANQAEQMAQKESQFKIKNINESAEKNGVKEKTDEQREEQNSPERQSKEDRLNEVMQQMRQDRLNEVKKTQEVGNLNETVNFKDVDYVSIEMFEKARYNSMMQVATRILPR